MAHEHEMHGNDRIDLGFAGLTAALGDHIGHYYQNAEECQALAVDYFAAGLQSGDEKCLYFCDDEARERIGSALSERGVDVAAALATGQLVFDGGRDSPEELTEVLQGVLAGVAGQYRRLRSAGDMGWVFGHMADVETVMEWETALNVVHAPQAVFFCQYDLARFAGSVIIDAMKSHPLSIVGSAVYENPYYIDPDEFLLEIRHRRKTPLKAA